MSSTLEWCERVHYRDLLRTARYAALADAEGFGEICFALEALGQRLCSRKMALGRYRQAIRNVAIESPVFGVFPEQYPTLFSHFDALFETLRTARNDAMHTGVYARHAATAAIELCIGLEDALMVEQQIPRNTVADYMVRSPLIVESWQPVSYARQIMLMHSFSFIPVYIDGWKLLPETAMARFVQRVKKEAKERPDRPIESERMAMRIRDAFPNVDSGLVDANVISWDCPIDNLLNEVGAPGPMLWLVTHPEAGAEARSLAGVLSPFELM
ncbi:hypothetical protein [Burkholderia arboris]|uniref:hypothetical protein n=1 Tax=Burkholderia arboris TaxID=488730 RepID=UPI002108D6CD|nr:hypothetical protein [Burkholderia arboris]UTV53306.1 hypothetical protein NLX30_10425 [Burkholderia arboris]